MGLKKFLFTSESVTEGHPDKICDQISDAVLDAVYENDPSGRVACETLITRGVVFIAGEITTKSSINISEIAREVLKEIGYDSGELGFDYKTCGVITAVQKQSPDIAQGVNIGGAGDQGLMMGYACKQTKELMPLPIILAHKLVKRLSQIRKEKIVDYLWPDGKSQVTIEYEGKTPKRVEAIIISTHHKSFVSQKTLQEDLKKLVINEVIPKEMMDKNTKIFINPTGKFEIGGPLADTGLTGRKIMVDTYGGWARHGGGCFSGKDPTKVDRSAAYMARYIAKNIVAADLADECEVQLAYCIGKKEPVGVMVNTFGTGKIEEEKLVKIIKEVFPLTPKGIIELLNLNRPIYKKTACYGHFGREENEFSWEKTDKVKEILKLI